MKSHDGEIDFFLLRKTVYVLLQQSSGADIVLENAYANHKSFSVL